MPLAPRDDALSEVVGFVLILGVIVLALSLYQLYGVPAVGRENEILHMNAVKDRFIDYKISLDSLWLNALGSATSSNFIKGVTLSTSFDLGTEGGYTQGGGVYIPILAPLPSGGTISVNKGYNDGLFDNISIRAVKGAEINEPVKNLPMGEVAFQSDNNYWIQQRYYYQMGGLFLAQDSGSTVRLSPCISISNQTTVLGVNVNAIEISGYQTTSGQGIARVDTRLRKENITTASKQGQDFVTITIDAHDIQTARVWRQVFLDAADRSGFTNIPILESTGVPPADEPIYLKKGNDEKQINITFQPVSPIQSINLDVTHARFQVSLQQVVT